MQQLQLRGAVAKVTETESKAALNMARARDLGIPDQPHSQDYQLPPELQNMQALADIEETWAGAQQKLARAHKDSREADLAPAWFAHEVATQAERSAETEPV